MTTANAETGVSNSATVEQLLPGDSPAASNQVPQTSSEDEASLLGISVEDMALLTQPSSLNVDTDDFSKIEEPHLLFDTPTLFERIKPLAVIVKDRQELVSKVVWVKPDPAAGRCHFTVNTGEVQARVTVELANNTRVMEGDFVVDFKAFFAVIRNSGSKFLIRDKNGFPTVTVLGGDVEFESYSVDRALFDSPAFKPFENQQKVEGGIFQRFVIRAAGSMALAARPEDRRVRVEDGLAYSNFLSSMFVQRDIPIKNLSLRSVDLVFLKVFLDGCPEFFYTETKDHYLFKTPHMATAFPKIDTSDIGMARPVIDGFQLTGGFTISPSHLYRVLLLMRNMIGASGTVKLSPKDGQLWVRANSKSGKNLQFPLAAVSTEVKVDISTPISALLSASLMLRKEAVVQTIVDNNRLILDGDGVVIAFGAAA